MTKLYEISLKKGSSKLEIQEGFKSSLSLLFNHLSTIPKCNKINGRVITVASLDFNNQELCFTGEENKYSSCNGILVYVPAYFSKTNGMIFTQNKYNLDKFVYMEDGDTLSLKVDNKEYYYIAVKNIYDTKLYRILIVD